jgi:hypothetical protein
MTEEFVLPEAPEEWTEVHNVNYTQLGSTLLVAPPLSGTTPGGSWPGPTQRCC